MTENKPSNISPFPNENECLERYIAVTDSQIDAIVYDLYVLTPEEIKIVEVG